VHTGQSGVPCRPLELPRVARGLRGRPLALATVGSPDSPMNYSHVAFSVFRERRVHRGRLTGQSDAPPDSPVNYSRTPPSSPESSLFTRTSLAHRTLFGAPPDSPVCQTEQKIGCTEPSLFLSILSSLVTVSSTWINTLVYKNQLLSLETYLVM
jgi:hypothetical protein